VNNAAWRAARRGQDKRRRHAARLKWWSAQGKVQHASRSHACCAHTQTYNHIGKIACLIGYAAL